MRGYGASISSRAGKTIKEIDRELKGARNTVSKVLREETSFEYERVVNHRTPTYAPRVSQNPR